jgi:hypothetical protein
MQGAYQINTFPWVLCLMVEPACRCHITQATGQFTHEWPHLLRGSSGRQ